MKNNFKPDPYRNVERKKERTALSKTKHDYIDFWSISLLKPRADDYTNMYLFSVTHKPNEKRLEKLFIQRYGFPVEVTHQTWMRTLYYRRNTYYVKLGKPCQWRDIEEATLEVVEQC